jgi:hypothetical protein
MNNVGGIATEEVVHYVFYIRKKKQRAIIR